jgi:hypothetical protein
MTQMLAFPFKTAFFLCAMAVLAPFLVIGRWLP